MRNLASSIAVVLLLTACASAPRSSAEPEVVAAALARGAAYDSRDATRIAAMYASGATFGGTTMKSNATTPPAALNYFKDAAALPNARVRFDSHNVRVLGETATDSGSYTFVDERNGEQTADPARFSMFFQRRGGRWVLVHHHSSRLP